MYVSGETINEYLKRIHFSKETHYNISCANFLTLDGEWIDGYSYGAEKDWNRFINAEIRKSDSEICLAMVDHHI